MSSCLMLLLISCILKQTSLEIMFATVSVIYAILLKYFCQEVFQVYLFSCFIASSGNKEGIDDIDFGKPPGSSSETKVKTIDSGNTPIKS